MKGDKTSLFFLFFSKIVLKITPRPQKKPNSPSSPAGCTADMLLQLSFTGITYFFPSSYIYQLITKNKKKKSLVITRFSVAYALPRNPI